MNIVVLDGKTTNPGDISWEPLEKLGNLTVYDDTPPEQLISRAKDAQAIVLNRCKLTEEVFSALPQLKYVCTLATGYNTIDCKAAAKRGIIVCNVPNYCSHTVAQQAFSLLLSLCSAIPTQTALVADGKYTEAVEESIRVPMTELKGKTMGILGMGSIGQEAARFAKAFSMEVIFANRSKKEVEGCRQVDLPTLFQESDVISIHCPLTEDTTGLVNASLLSLMKPTAFLINTARGAVIQEQDLADALNRGILAGAGLDVLSQEPPAPDCPLLTAKNCLITPHVAWSSREARQRLITIVGKNLESCLAGSPQNQVN